MIPSLPVHRYIPKHDERGAPSQIPFRVDPRSQKCSRSRCGAQPMKQDKTWKRRQKKRTTLDHFGSKAYRCLVYAVCDLFIPIHLPEVLIMTLKVPWSHISTNECPPPHVLVSTISHPSPPGSPDLDPFLSGRIKYEGQCLFKNKAMATSTRSANMSIAYIQVYSCIYIYIYIVKTGEQRGPTAIELLHIKISKCPLLSNEHLSILEPYPASSRFNPWPGWKRETLL